MNHGRSIILFGLSLLILTAGCMSLPISDSRRKKMIERANIEAEKMGYDLSIYTASVVRERGGAVVLYQMKDPRKYGYGIKVIIDDTTGQLIRVESLNLER